MSKSKHGNGKTFYNKESFGVESCARASSKYPTSRITKTTDCDSSSRSTSSSRTSKRPVPDFDTEAFLNRQGLYIVSPTTENTNSTDLRTPSNLEEPVNNTPSNDRHYIEIVRSIHTLKDAMCQMFETIQNNCQAILDRQHLTEQQLADLSEEISNVPDNKIPQELSAQIKSLYALLKEDEKWDIDEVCSSDINQQKINAFAVNVGHHLKGKHGIHLIKRACTVYFTSLRKDLMQREKDPEKYKKLGEQKKMRSRRQRLFENRSKVVSPDEKDTWLDVTQELMSDEEDHVDGTLRVKSPHWRHPYISSFIKELDARIQEKEDEKGEEKSAKKRRVPGISPMKRKPSKRVKTHLLDEDSEDNEDTDLT